MRPNRLNPQNSIREELLHSRPYFTADALPDPTPKYVCWLDLLGARSAMNLSLKRAVNFIGKIHGASLKVQKPRGLELFPVIDGVYVVSESQQALLAYLREVLAGLGSTFAFETDNWHRFLFRCGISYGPIILGREMAQCGNELANNPEHINAVAIGSAVGQAYGAEGEASPLGVYIHESARSFAPRGERPFGMAHYKWLGNSPKESFLRDEIKRALVEYYSWLERNDIDVLYPSPKYQEHFSLAKKYFNIEE